MSISSEQLLDLVSFISAGICVGIGAIGPAWGAGIAGGAGVIAFGKREQTRSVILKVMLIAMAVAGSTGIYALVVALLLMYVV